MLLIIGSMLGGWILQLFGFDLLVATGMMELFGVAITKTGYYFMFALIGMMRSIVVVARNASKVQVDANTQLEKLFKKGKK